MRKEYLIKRLFAIFAIFASYTIVQASINPTISFLNSYAIDKNKKVGEIPCSTNVNDMGIVSINVPIESPTSPDGINPQISINYNSIGGSGILGYGWNLSATSIISRFLDMSSLICLSALVLFPIDMANNIPIAACISGRLR